MSTCTGSYQFISYAAPISACVSLLLGLPLLSLSVGRNTGKNHSTELSNPNDRLNKNIIYLNEQIIKNVKIYTYVHILQFKTMFTKIVLQTVQIINMFSTTTFQISTTFLTTLQSVNINRERACQ